MGDTTVLDVGCGDGLIDRHILDRRPDLSIAGIDVMLRHKAHISVQKFDGSTIPYKDDDFDFVLFIDVLHHMSDPMVLLREACRVARQGIVLKDHNVDGLLAGPTLKFMDWVGNAPHGVVLPYNYWAKRRWQQAFQALGLEPVYMQPDLGLYPPPMSFLFDRSLHFIARLDKSSG